ncbi:MAG: bifunctional demethylmenaquinone methyltransferase/2-methoxy-6-polyprenyl-1,4-benzoquinol methylase UbiE [Anaerolineae bacterium]|nr:bifunctional demethylmenaquinone methyltransferase/2-methoxy-6-polyprenyl-1,4-benzoquinol methylase UbiE [Anaerolineae bacterium]
MTPEERSKRVQTMFSRIAGRYDLMNRVMTGGRDIAWRRAAVRELNLPANGQCLDLATGTGDLAFAVLERYPDAKVVGMDFSEGILRGAVKKSHERAETRTAWGVGDALALPYDDAQFDGLTNGFLLRNVVDLPRCLRELRRVTKPGGKVVCLEITHPQTPIFKQLFHVYFYKMVPIIGGIISGDPQAYSYLPNSLSLFPPAKPLLQKFREAGYRDAYYKTLGLGTMAIHVGVA